MTSDIAGREKHGVVLLNLATAQRTIDRSAKKMAGPDYLAWGAAASSGARYAGGKPLGGAKDAR
jgi:hypothetical protein